jgi:hypothetical protein
MARLTALQKLLRAERLDREAVAKTFEEAEPQERVRMMETIDARGQAKLWSAAAGRTVSVNELVPPELGPLMPVVFDGKNSLPAFTRFQKHFCRPAAEGAANELWGYNYQPSRWLAALTGPGYFVAYDTESSLETVAVDYRRIPTSRPPEWPEIRDNRYRLSRFIFNGMVDYLLRVSEHLLIGRATRDDKELDNYFLLCRRDPV